MSKTTGSYESLIRGVSQQVPHDRLPGQHWVQDNLISDPVRGLARRHGSRRVAEKLIPGLVLDAATLDDAAQYKEYSFYLAGVEYSIAYRPGAKVVGSTMPGVVCSNKDTGQILDVAVNPGDGRVLDVLNTGISTVTPVGNFVLLGASEVDTTYTSFDTLASTAAFSVAWVKGGAYSRTFTVSCYFAADPPITVSYTTMTSYYPGVLDTSDIVSTDTAYQKKVNDRVYAYQTLVNQHIGLAAADIQPQNIAEELRLALIAAGVPGVTRSGAHLLVIGPTSITVDDGGSGELIKAIAQEVETASDLSAQHIVGKVVRVIPRQAQFASDSYYLRATAKSPGLTGMQEVVWREAAGLEIRPGFVALLGAVVGTTLYLGSSASHLEAASGLTDVPRFTVSSAGDVDSSPTPTFLGKKIAYMRSFQDRLMIVSGAVVFMSKSGDYFNFFRQSALTLADDDPIEIFAEGSEGDLVTDAVQMDRNLLLFGRRQQYAVPGREAVVPRNAFIAVQSAHEDTTTSPPVASGNLVFFTQQRDNRLTVQQMQTGAYVDSFDAFDISTQLDGYLTGTPRQIVAMTSPSMLFIRTAESRESVFVYSYLDSPGQQQRLLDSWSRWEWSTTLGTLFSITSHNSNLLALTLRTGLDGAYIVLDRFVRESQLSDYPYLDSWRPWLETGAGTIRPGWAGEEETAVALSNAAGDFRLLGRELADAAVLFQTVPGTEAFAVVGTYFESVVEPTAPYIRDRKDKAILDGRLTVTKLAVTLSDSAAFRSTLRGMTEPESLAVQGINWMYRQAGLWVLNTQPVADTATVTVPIMREIRDYRLQLKSRNWLPFTLSSIEYSGQFFTARRS